MEPNPGAIPSSKGAGIKISQMIMHSIVNITIALPTFLDFLGKNVQRSIARDRIAKFNMTNPIQKFVYPIKLTPTPIAMAGMPSATNHERSGD
jgi:hypothetical protein